MPGPVLITGCSTGIGRAAAERLARAGMTVYASARRPESIEDLKAAGCRTLALDVTDEDSMRAAVEENGVAVVVIPGEITISRLKMSRSTTSSSSSYTRFSMNWLLLSRFMKTSRQSVAAPRARCRCRPRPA